MKIHSLSAVEHILKHRPERILSLALAPAVQQSPRGKEILKQAGELGLRVQEDRGTHEGPGSGATAEIKNYEYTPWESLRSRLEAKAESLVVVLDHLQDPQNFGALCRSAEALGVDAVFIPQNRSVSVTPAVYQASAGAVETLPICRVVNLSTLQKQLKEIGYWTVASTLAEGAQGLESLPKLEKKALILGSEGDGVSTQIEKASDFKVRLETPGKIQSMNVSAAGAVLMWELGKRN